MPHTPREPAHGPSSVAEHKTHAPARIPCYLVTCSDSRGPADDMGGQAMRAMLEEAGHAVVGQRLVSDEPAAIREALAAAVAAGARAVLFSGGTGLSARDVTVEALRPLLEREIPGFGELFRALSYAEIGSAAWLSRALAGTHGSMLVFALPGSPNAVRLALHKLVLPELGHAVRELGR